MTDGRKQVVCLGTGVFDQGKPVFTDSPEVISVVAENPDSVEIPAEHDAVAAIQGFIQLFQKGLAEAGWQKDTERRTR